MGEKIGVEIDVETGKARRTVGQLREELKGLKNLATIEIDPAKLKSINADIQQVGKELKTATNLGKQGFDELGNSVGKTTNGFQKAFSGLRNIANILPGTTPLHLCFPPQYL